MITKYYAVYDKKAEAFMNPFGSRTNGEAIRSFMDAVRDANSPFHKYPEDFYLARIGEWNDATGKLVSADDEPIAIIGGLDCVKSA